jgi:hypothetical protein
MQREDSLNFDSEWVLIFFLIIRYGTIIIGSYIYIIAQSQIEMKRMKIIACILIIVVITVSVDIL